MKAHEVFIHFALSVLQVASKITSSLDRKELGGYLAEHHARVEMEIVRLVYPVVDSFTSHQSEMEEINSTLPLDNGSTIQLEYFGER